jgi:NADH-quinone oxidoreductase subunit F
LKNKLHTKDDLLAHQKKMQSAASLVKTKIMICAGTGCVAGGSLELFEEFKAQLATRGIDASVTLQAEDTDPLQVAPSGCHGFCEMGPLVRFEPQGLLYVKVTTEDVADIVTETVLGGRLVERLIYKHPPTGEGFPLEEEIPFYRHQQRVVLQHCGTINPDDINEYFSVGGYGALVETLAMEPSAVCRIIERSNLRGRGGGGFPAGSKWESVRREPGEVKYVVCNGDEGDPGAFMDRSIMEGNPHLVIEGMIIGGYAAGARQGYIYVRAEYPLAVKRLQRAIESAREYGLLGVDILDSGFDFDIKINRGAGAFVCGEGSAMTASIEGRRGMPRTKPPRTVQQGLWAKPTLLNNVETFANIPSIILRGPEWFLSIGSPNNAGTKAFALTGNILNTGLIEVPLGITLREIINNIGGGVPEGRKFKAVQIGGPSGGCLTREHLDLPIDFDSLIKAGAMIGSGGLVVMDDQTCMVEVARFFMSFTQRESCGKCVPCREGTKRMLQILETIVQGKATLADLDLLAELAETVTIGSLCGLGKTAANPILTTLRYFRDEYEAHVADKKCPVKVCKTLATYIIDLEKCKGCSKCARVCPANAITGRVKEPFAISLQKCIKCGACVAACPFDAVLEV